MHASLSRIKRNDMALEPEFPSNVSKGCIRAFQLFNRLLFELGMGEMRAAGA
jgi:hypothetical protein